MLEVRTDVALVPEYEQWLAEAATRRIKEIIDLELVVVAPRRARRPQ
jgi:hypothetical protein